MEKISAEYPAAIVREGGLAALLNFLPFFSTNVQRTAVTAAANCCRNISSEHFTMIRDVFPTLREVLTQADQRLVEQATLAVVRTLESYRHNASHLEGLLDVPTVVAINALLMPSGGSPLISDGTYTHLLKALTSAARASGEVTIAFLEAGMTSTVHHILTGVLPSSHEEDEQGGAPGGQGLGGGVADMVIMHNLAHRPKEQVEEALGLICELLPPIPRDGVFDHRSYTEKNLSKIKRGRGRSERSKQRKSDETEAPSTGPSTPAEPANPSAAAQATPIPALGVYNSSKARRDAEQQYEQRVTLLKSKSEVVAKFMRALVPVLVDVYAASVSLRVRTKALTGLVKAAAFASPTDLELTLTVSTIFKRHADLQSVPMASFLGAIISSKDNPTFVQHALQLVELLATKLPHVFLTSFQREGVVFEIESLAALQLTSEKEKEKVKEEIKSEAGSSTQPAAGDPSTPKAGSSAAQGEDVKPVNPTADLPNILAALVHESAAHGTPSRSSATDPNDANITRARIIGAKKIFAVDGDQQNEAAVVLDSLARQVARLRVPEATEAELRESLRDIAAQFCNVGQALSSFELLKSGLVDGLLEYVDIDGVVSSSARRAIFYDIFSDTAIASPSPLTMLVKRLHESLGRLENFEVETAFNGAAGFGSSSSSLGRSMRIRLLAEEGEDIPKQIGSLSVTIQAIAPVQALHDYLRPRIAEPGYLSGSALHNMFAAYAARGGGGNSPTSRLLAALAAGAGGGPGNPFGTVPGSSAAPASSSAPAAATDGAAATAKKDDKTPQRRRSARLSGHAPAEADSAEQPKPAAEALGTSPGEPSVLPQMPVSMDFDDDYSDDEYDAEVFEEDMEDELERPVDKVVNMSMAPGEQLWIPPDLC